MASIWIHDIWLIIWYLHELWMMKSSHIHVPQVFRGIEYLWKLSLEIATRNGNNSDDYDNDCFLVWLEGFQKWILRKKMKNECGTFVWFLLCRAAEHETLQQTMQFSICLISDVVVHIHVGLFLSSSMLTNMYRWYIWQESDYSTSKEQLSLHRAGRGGSVLFQIRQYLFLIEQ